MKRNKLFYYAFIVDGGRRDKKNPVRTATFSGFNFEKVIDGAISHLVTEGLVSSDELLIVPVGQDSDPVNRIRVIVPTYGVKYYTIVVECNEVASYDYRDHECIATECEDDDKLEE